MRICKGRRKEGMEGGKGGREDKGRKGGRKNDGGGGGVVGVIGVVWRLYSECVAVCLGDEGLGIFDGIFGRCGVLKNDCFF